MARPQSRTDRPDNYYVNPSKPKNGYAYPDHPPSKRCTQWYWKYIYYDAEGKKHLHALGRIERHEIPRILLDKFGVAPSFQTIDYNLLKTVYDCLSSWYEYRETYDSVAPRTLQNNLSCCRALKKAMGDILLMELQVGDVEHFKRTQKGKATSINQKVNVLRQALGWFKERGGRIPIELSSIKSLPTKAPEPFVPRKASIDHLIQQCTDPNEILAMQIAYYTGARVHSLGLLRWKDIYQRNGIDIMLIKDRKNARRKGKAVGEVLEREVIIEAKLLDILHHHPGEKKGLLFEKRFIDTLSTNIGDLSEALGEPRITMSNFRSYRATQLHLRGVPPKVYEQQMGHSTRVAERYYIQVSVEDAARYIKTIS